MKFIKQLFPGTLFVLIFLLFASACAVQRNPVTGQKRLFGYSWSQEVQIGREVDQEMLAQYGVYSDEAVAAYVHEIGKIVLAESHMRRESTDRQFRETEFHFRVLDSPVVNAFALPGGYVYVTRGLLTHLNNEAQLAVVLGHEIGHVAARHASQRALQQTLGQIAIIGGAVLGQEFLGIPGESFLSLSSQAAQLIFLSYSRDAERESDQLGVEYAAMAGYKASEGAAFFTSLKRISAQHGHSIPSMLSSHPDPGEREQNIPRLASGWAEQGYEQTITNQEAYLKMIEGMTFGDNPREGFVTDGWYVHPELRFRFPVPAGFRLFNERQQVLLVSESENAVMIFRIDGLSKTPEESVQSFISQEGITVHRQNEAITGDEHPAWEAEVSIEQESQVLRALVYSIEFDGRIYRFINYSPESAYDQYVEAFSHTSSRFHTLEDPDLLNVQPVRIQLIETEEDQIFSEILPETLPMNISSEDVAIINQFELDQVVPQGSILKIPVQ
ncbi:M48 family metalloprotease [Balneolaceae bacterium ANBcel3]|nr:M48 family metalloprotease [Balneolaceae bacterium ANBcel3]